MVVANRAEGELPGLRIDVLAKRAGELARVGNEPSPHTVASHERRWRQWQQFADHFGVSALPADSLHVAAFVVAPSSCVR